VRILCRIFASKSTTSFSSSRLDLQIISYLLTPLCNVPIISLDSIISLSSPNITIEELKSLAILIYIRYSIKKHYRILTLPGYEAETVGEIKSCKVSCGFSFNPFFDKFTCSQKFTSRFIISNSHQESARKGLNFRNTYL